MKRWKSIAGVIAGIFIFGEIVKGLNYLYVPEKEDSVIWGRILWHNFYEDQGKIDNLFLGSSHVYCDIDSQLLDECNQQYNFNLSSSAQLMNGTYYLLREADRNNELSHVYIELYYRFNVKAANESKEPIITEYGRNWCNADYMRFSLNRLFYRLTMTDVEKYPETWLKFIRYRDSLSDWSEIADTLNWKKSNDYLNYRYHALGGENHERETEYREKGYYYTTAILKQTERSFEQDVILQEDSLAESSEKYLRKTITYCQKKNIPITLFVSPIYELQLISTENYDNYINQVRGIAEEYQIDFYDFNLAKAEYLPIQNPEYFMDIGHLNKTGADMFTKFFYQVISGDADDNKMYFYNSYAEKQQNQKPEVFGIYYRDRRILENDENFVWDMWIASNREDEMEYRITFIPYDNKKQELIQDFSNNKKFMIETGKTGTFFIEYRLKSNPDFIETVEIEI